MARMHNVSLSVLSRSTHACASAYPFHSHAFYKNNESIFLIFLWVIKNNSELFVIGSFGGMKFPTHNMRCRL
jgi:hypothetical protein